VSKSEIINFFDTYENFNYMTDWVESFIKPEFQLDGDDRSYKYGSKWFDFYISEELDDDELIIGGDSAWSPMIGLCQALSNQYKCEIRIDFEE